MSALEQWDDDAFISLMSGELSEEMNDQLAQQEAIADYRSEQQAKMMGVSYEGL